MGLVPMNIAAALRDGLSDLAATWARRDLAFYFAWSETRARYRRSVLGPFWLVLGTAIGVAGLGFVWSAVLGRERSDFIPSLTIGLVVWQLISGVVVDAAAVFPRNATSILNIQLPTFLTTLQAVLRQLVNFGHNLVVVLLVLLIYPQHLSVVSLLALPGILLVAVSLFFTVQFVGYLGARFRDIDPLIGALMPLLFFLSPVIYEARQLGPAQAIMNFNPIAHWIVVVRDPLMGVAPPLASWVIVLVIGLAAMAGSLWLTGARRHRLPYWL